MADELLGALLSLSPREKIRRLYDTLVWRINSPTCEFRFGDARYNASLLLTALTCLVRGKMCLLGPSGTGKSTLVETAAQLVFGDPPETLQAATIYGHAELSFEDLERALLPRAAAGPESTPPSADRMVKDVSQVSILFIDDLSGLAPSARTLLNTLLEEGLLVRRNVRHRVAPKPVFATSNRLSWEDESGRALYDRFQVACIPTGLNPEWIGTLARGRRITRFSGRGYTLDAQDLADVRRDMDGLKIHADLLNRMEFFLAELSYCDRLSADPRFRHKAAACLEDAGRLERLCDGCALLRRNPSLVCAASFSPVSTRALEALVLYLRALTWFLGGAEVAGRDLVEQLLPYVFLHRLRPRRGGREEGAAESGDASAAGGVEARVPWLRGLWRDANANYDRFAPILESHRDGLASLMNPEVCPDDAEALAADLRSQLERIESPGRSAYLDTLENRLDRRLRRAD